MTVHLTAALDMTERDWNALAGGTDEAAWLASRTAKLAYASELAGKVLKIATALEQRDATFRCSEDVLDAVPQAAYWYVSLAGLAMKTLGNITSGPKGFGLNRSVKGFVETLFEGDFRQLTQVRAADKRAFSDWVNDELDRLYAPSDRNARQALIIVSMLAGGRALGQSQNAGGDLAVTLFKTEVTAQVVRGR